DRNAGVLVRKPIPIDDIRNIQSECRAIDDDMRWLIALISDTGMRLAEGAGLLKQDFIGLDTDLPYVCVTKHPWRNLKTASSERKIPLIGEALWAAKRIVKADTADMFLTIIGKELIWPCCPVWVGFVPKSHRLPEYRRQ
ncbi:MAG: hypothetical protein K0U49_01595, partial [Alphaproteobacteria bacterium]|nr:hypothetical protein [Alphaproteobacteria bacterium]